MKELSGRDLAGFVKERQAGEVARLVSAGVRPKLVIFYDNDSPVIMRYVELKRAYGADVGIEVDIIQFSSRDAKERVRGAAKDPAVHGIIVQLPLMEVDEDILSLIPPEKDVDGLNGGMVSATAEAINWLLAGHNVDLKGKRIAVVGRGRLVGEPLIKMWNDSGYEVVDFGKGDDLGGLKDFEIVVSATGVPELIRSEMIRSGAVVVDAGTASEDGALVGDVADEVREREDVVITPKVGGVGPLTVGVLFEHLVEASKK